jgi:homoserine dehydrogenase
MSKQLTIGLFGFGCVGQGLYEVLNKSVSFKADFKKICIKHPEKKRILPDDLFTTDKWEILNDPAINTVVELIDDADEAYQIISTALKNKKNVATANKKVLAEHLEELLQLQKENNVSLIYEASVCGGIPIIRTLEEYYDNEELESVSGIFNGSSNFILSKIYKEGISYSKALVQAQSLGFAETDPTLDVEGFDPKFKLIILALHAYGIILRPDQVFHSGISNFGAQEIDLYTSFNIQVKLNPVLQKKEDGKISAYVISQLIGNQHPLVHVNNEYNAVIVEGAFSDEQLFIGKGAGGHPTGAAVLSDISALSYAYKYEYKKYYQNLALALDNSTRIPIYVSGKHASLLKIFDETEIADTSQGSFVIIHQSIQWLLEHQSAFAKNKLFVAKIHADILENLQVYHRKNCCELCI